MNLHIIALGKKKSEYDAQIAEYKKRIVTPFSLTIEILDQESTTKNILGKIKPGDFFIALDERGKDLTTVQISKFLDKKLHDGIKRLVFVIGGAYGLDEVFKQQAGLLLRLGAITLPHELARLVLVEQLYRTTNLLAGGKYHHE